MYFNVPFAQKDQAKALGARWDPTARSWYAPDSAVAASLASTWQPRDQAGSAAPQHSAAPERQPASNNQAAAAAPDEARRYFYIPFDSKDEARCVGGRWDVDNKMWYVTTDAAAAMLTQRGFAERPLNPLTTIVGEDRSYGGNRLFVDMIPSTAWYANVRSMIHPAEWDRVRAFVYRRANHRCECCGVDTSDPTAGPGGTKTWLEAHERWAYDSRHGVQTLKRLVALCHECHEATHMGLAQVNDRASEATAHLARVRGESVAAANAHIARETKLWNQRSALDWTADISIISNSGVQTVPAGGSAAFGGGEHCF